MRSIDSFIYKPIVIFILLMLAAIAIHYFLYLLGINIVILRYLTYIIAITLSLFSASTSSKKLREETLNIKILKTEIEQFEPVIKEIKDINKKFEDEMKILNSSIENLAKTGVYKGKNEFLLKASENIQNIETSLKGIVRFSINKWDNITKGINELKQAIEKKNEKLENINKFSEVLALGKYDFRMEDDAYINNNLNKAVVKMNSIILEKNELAKILEQKEIEIRELNERLRVSKSKETLVTMSSGAVKITAPKRAANVDSKDFIDFTGRGLGKY